MFATTELRTSLQQEDFHNALHTPKKPTDPVYSRFFDEDDASAWYSPDMQVELPVRQTDDMYDEMASSYTIPSHLSYLKVVMMVQQTPQLEVADEYKQTIRIAWTPNLAYANLESGVLHIGDAETYPIDRHYVKIFMNHHTKDAAKLERTIGNRPELTSWTTLLRRDVVGVKHPFFFYRTQNAGLLVKLTCNYISYRFVRDLGKLLRCQKLVEGEWRHCQLMPEYLKSWTNLKAPLIYGIGTSNTNQEMKGLRCLAEGDVREIYITDVQTISSSNPTDQDQQVFDLNRRNPCKGIFFVAENNKATKQNYYCNYTADPEDHTAKLEPLANGEVLYDTKRRAITYTTGVIEDMVDEELFPTTPYCPGIHSISFSLSPFQRDETGVVFPNQDGITSKIAFRFPSPRDTSIQYTIRCYLLVQRCIRYTLRDGEHIVDII